jgi:antitoxin component YwqK of YwqJK toxin-antitoxin module
VPLKPYKACGLKGAALMEWLKYLVIQKDETGILINNWKQGARYFKSDNSILEYEYNYLDDRRHGIQRGWYENGQLNYEHNYDHGQYHGIQRCWYEDGQLSYEDNYKCGYCHGIHCGWYEDGQLQYKKKYINGVFQK